MLDGGAGSAERIATLIYLAGVKGVEREDLGQQVRG